MKKKQFAGKLICLLLTLTMVLEMFSGLAISAQAADTDDTDLTIDFGYREENNISSASEALIREGEENRTLTIVDADYYYSSSNQYQWRKIYEGDYTPQAGEFRRAMESSAAGDKYVVLMEDVETTPGKTEYYTIQISSDKVLDLNGHSLTLWDFRNKTDGSDKYSQSKNPDHHRVVMFEIINGATLTIVDSSAYQYDDGQSVGTGKIVTGAYMIDPYKYDIRYYTTRDLFRVSDGNLVIYGGTYKAGRQKDQLKSNFSWNGLKEVVGNAVQFGVSITEYATGIEAAKAVEADLQETFKNEDKEKETGNESTGSDTSTTNPESSTVKKDGSGAKAEEKKDTPTEKATESNKDAGRNKTVTEKEESKKSEDGSGDKKDKNEANEEGTAKYDRNSQIAKAEKDIVNAVVNKDKITTMVDDAFELGAQIKKLIGSDERSRVTQSIHGTCVHVGNKGTLVVYNGKFMGYGSTANTRNAVIEVTKQAQKSSFDSEKYKGGQVYIYGGTFEGYTGANIFNMVKSNTEQTAVQYEKDENGKVTEKTVTLHPSETNNLEMIYYENQDKVAADSSVEPIPVNTSNVMIRGGTFRNYYEITNVAILGEDEYNGKENDEEGNENQTHFHKFTGTAGSINVGVESFGKDLIRDGRIQINDKYGDGALVLMDETENQNSGISHYRLFCGNTELRYKQYLEVYPNKAKTNSTHSFKLETYYGDKNQQKVSEVWKTDEKKENIREAAFSNDEYFFSYAIDGVAADTYYVMPKLTDTDVYGENLDTAKVWYYNEPVDADGDKIPDFKYVDTVAGGVLSNGFEWQASYATSSQSLISDAIKSSDPNTVYSYQAVNDSYKVNMKWFKYKIYRVDPLTRENISESRVYGVDEPLAEVVYGTDSTSLKCKLPLKEVENQIKKIRTGWKGYQPGELYRIVFSVEEHIGYQNAVGTNFKNVLNPASAESTVLFRCYSIEELQDQGGDTSVEDFTPLQWSDDTVAAGNVAGIDIINGKAGQVDFAGNKIFDVYYQWWKVDDEGNELRLLAGTDNIYEGDLTGKEYHTYEYWNVGKDGHLYARTVDPKNPSGDTSGVNNMPKNKLEWTGSMLGAYTHEMTDVNLLKEDITKNLSLENNDIYYSNHNSCYIPENLVGSKIRVKAIVVNCKWDDNYDKKQTFYSHIMEVTEAVAEVDVKIDYPKPGQTPDYTPEYPADAKYEQEQNVIWEVRGADNKWTVMKSTDTFVNGKDYRVTIDTALQPGEAFSDDLVVRVNGERADEIQKWSAYNGSEEYEGVACTKTYTCSDSAFISWAEVQAEAPTAGKTPNYKIKIPFGAKYGIDHYKDDTNYDVVWYKIIDGQWISMEQTEQFAAGDHVGLEVYLVPNWDAQFYYPEGAINGNETSVNWDGGRVLVLETEFTVKEAEEDKVITRISGASRYETGYKVADAYKEKLGAEQFKAVVIATGKNFADALSGSYLSVVKNAPILLTNGKSDNIATLHEYIKENVRSGGTIYILGGEAAVPEEVENILGYQIKRLSGKTRYDTNIEILNEAGVSGTELIVATGKAFADSLSASAVGKPILLVKPGTALSADQKDILSMVKGGLIYIIGGEGAVAKATATELKSYATVYRISGSTRYETSVAVAKQFFGTTENAVIASGKNFPDGLCGGPLAAAMNAPLILTADGKTTAAEKYVKANAIESGFVLGGTGALSDKTVIDIFSLSGSEDILIK